MMKSFFAVAFLLLTSSGFTQVHFGGQIHGAITSASVKTNDNAGITKTSKTKFGAGVIAGIMLRKNLELRSGLNYIQRGVDLKAKTSPRDIGFRYNIDLHYLELPLAIVYNLPVKKHNLFFGAGPTFGYGISGKVAEEGTYYYPGQQPFYGFRTLNAFTSESNGGAGLKPFEVGATVFTGFGFNNGLFLQVGGQFGLTNSGNANMSYRNNAFQLSAGYMLGKKK